jgi:hypothetical protein
VTDDSQDWLAFRRVLRKAEYAEELEVENYHLRLARDILRELLEECQERVAELERRVSP